MYEKIDWKNTLLKIVHGQSNYSIKINNQLSLVMMTQNNTIYKFI